MLIIKGDLEKLRKSEFYDEECWDYPKEEVDMLKEDENYSDIVYVSYKDRIYETKCSIEEAWKLCNIMGSLLLYGRKNRVENNIYTDMSGNIVDKDGSIYFLEIEQHQQNTLAIGIYQYATVNRHGQVRGNWKPICTWNQRIEFNKENIVGQINKALNIKIEDLEVVEENEECNSINQLKELEKIYNEFEVEDNLKQYVDSMLFEEHTIASFNKGRYSVNVGILGENEVYFKNRLYTNANDFPEELRKIIKENKIIGHKNIEVIHNNWFEIVFFKKNNNNTYESIHDDVFEEDISTMSKEELKDYMNEYLDEIIENELKEECEIEEEEEESLEV